MTEADNFNCPIEGCGYTTESSRGLSVHKTKTHDDVVFIDGECENCHSSISKRKSQVSDSGNMFCDQSCYKDWTSGKNHHNHKEKITLTCEFCSDQFTVHQYRSNDARFCSQECSGKHKTQNGTTEVDCDWCDNTFTKWNNDINRSEHNFCSKDCYGEWSSVNKTGQNHPNWTGGANLYEAIRENLSDKSWSEIAELSRDNSCYKCGKRAENLHEHHIIPIMYGGINTEELLMTLCPSCHRTVESYTMNTLQQSIIEVV